MKRCPFCVEEIQDAAVKCRHCGSMLAMSSRKEWYFKPGLLAAAFLLVGPLMLPLLWLSPHASRRAKWIWTVVIVAISAVLAWAFIWALGQILEMYRQIGL